MFYAAARRDRSVFSTFLQPRLSPAGAFAVRVATPLIIRIASKAHGSTDERARQDFARLPENLDRVDGWLGDGTLGGSRLNAADYQIAPNVRAMLHLSARPQYERAAGVFDPKPLRRSIVQRPLSVFCSLDRGRSISSTEFAIAERRSPRPQPRADGSLGGHALGRSLTIRDIAVRMLRWRALRHWTCRSSVRHLARIIQRGRFPRSSMRPPRPGTNGRIRISAFPSRNAQARLFSARIRMRRRDGFSKCLREAFGPAVSSLRARGLVECWTLDVTPDCSYGSRCLPQLDLRVGWPPPGCDLEGFSQNPNGRSQIRSSTQGSVRFGSQVFDEEMSQSRYPPGWDESRVRRVLEFYDTQTDEEAVAEDEATWVDTSHTKMDVPDELVSTVRELIAKMEQRGKP